MSLTCHLVVDSYDESRGGLAQSVVRIAAHLARVARRVHVYSLQAGNEDVRPDWPAGIEPVALATTKRQLQEPFAGEMPAGAQAEGYETDYLAVRAAVLRRLGGDPSDRHLVVSLHLSHAGFVAQHLADGLGVPHLTSVRGSDFNRDFRYPGRFSLFSYVVTRAAGLITTNQEQWRILNAVFGCGARTTTVYNSVDLAAEERHRPPPVDAAIRIVADCGYSFKKGSHLLLRAFADLRAAGLPVRLTLVGRMEERRAAYWTALRQEVSGAWGESVELCDWIPRDAVRRLLAAGHLYASATLSEGSSNARLAALAYGIPIVSTRCAELADLAGDADHVRLCVPGDGEELRDGLRAMVARLLAGEVTVSCERVDHWRRLLAPAVERSEWCAAAQRAAAG